MQSLMPEFFMLLGIDLFLALSLLTAVFDKHFPDKLAYLYQLVALAGFGQLLVTKEFMATFADYMRFWYSALYLAIALTNILGLNAYLYFHRKAITLSKLFALGATTPTLIIATLFLYNYTLDAATPILALPLIPLETMFLSLFAFDLLVVGTSIYVLVKPKWWHITAPAAALLTAAIIFASQKPALGDAAFITSAIYVYVILGIACVGVLGAGLYVLVRFWLDKNRKGGETIK